MKRLGVWLLGIALTVAVMSQVTSAAADYTIMVAGDIFARPMQMFWGTSSPPPGACPSSPGNNCPNYVWTGDAAASNSFSVAPCPSSPYNCGMIAGTGSTYSAQLGPSEYHAQVGVVVRMNTYQSAQVGVVARWQNAANWYNAYIDGSNLVLQKAVDGAVSVLGHVAFTAMPLHAYVIYILAVGTSISAKVFEAGQTANWMISVTDTSLTHGYAGIRSQLQAGETQITYDFFDYSDPTYVAVCGTQLCLDGQPWTVHGATSSGQYQHPDYVASTAPAGNLNVVEATEFDCAHHVLTDTQSPCTWNQMDAYVTKVETVGLHVVLNLSEYGQSLIAAGQNFTTTDWGPYLQFIADRVNVLDSRRYSDNDTIAMIELFGEPPDPRGDGSTDLIPGPGTAHGCSCTTAQFTAWEQRTLAEARADFPNAVISTGGFSFLNIANNGIDWQTIMSDANDQVCAIELNSANDRNMTVPMVTSYCQGIGKPWFLSAWSACQKPQPAPPAPPVYNNFGNSDGTPNDAAAEVHISDMYDIAGGASPATYPAIGTDFWNLGPATSNTCEQGPQFPISWAEIQSGV